MPRRVESPDEFTFADGLRVTTPTDMVALLDREPARVQEVWERFAEGDVGRWLRHLGQEAMVQGVEALQQRGLAQGDGLPLLVRLLATGVLPPAAGPETPGPAGAGAVAAAPIAPPLARSAGGSRSPEARAPDVLKGPDLVMRQRAAVLAFWRCEEERAQAERARIAEAEVGEKEAEAGASDLHAKLRDRTGEIGQAWRQGQQALEGVGLGSLLRQVEAPPPPPGAAAAEELDRAIERARQAARDLGASATSLRAHRRELEARRRAAIFCLQAWGATLLAVYDVLVGWVLWPGLHEWVGAGLVTLVVGTILLGLTLSGLTAGRRPGCLGQVLLAGGGLSVVIWGVLAAMYGGWGPTLPFLAAVLAGVAALVLSAGVARLLTRRRPGKAIWLALGVPPLALAVAAAAVVGGLFLLPGTGVGRLSRPALLSPADGATGVPLPPTLAWEECPSADGYRVDVAEDSSFGEESGARTWMVASATSLSFPQLAPDTTYWWRVRAYNEWGTGRWSRALKFTTAAPPPPLSEAPRLVSPAAGAQGVSSTPTLRWAPLSGVSSYAAQVATDAAFGHVVYQGSYLTGTSITLERSLAAGTKHWWRVAGQGPDGPGPWSAPWTFATQGSQLGAPALSSPANGASGVSLTPTLSWGAASGVASYQVQVSRNSSFTDLAVNQSGLTGLSAGVGPLARATRYWWRVRGSGAGTPGPWSGVRSFTTMSAGPPAPGLLSPRYGALGVSATAVLAWAPSQGATSYRVQVASNPSFTKVVFDRSGITRTSVTVSGLSPNTEYWWWVCATGAGGSGDWPAAAWNFTTGAW